MGLSQETNVSSNDREGGRQNSMCSAPVEQENNMEDRNTTATEEYKDARAMRFKRNEESEKKCEVKEKEQNDNYKLKDKRDTKECSSKTKKLISKLQEKKEDCKDKERRDESWKRESGDSKTREMISRLQEKGKEEKNEREMRAEFRKRQDSKMKGLFFKLEENQNVAVESKKMESDRADDKEKTEEQVELVKLISNGKEKEIIPKDVRKHIDGTEKQSEKEKRDDDDNNQVNEVLKMSSIDIEKNKPKAQNEIQSETPESNKEEKVGNCVEENNLKIMSKEEQEEEESASMFAKDLDRLHSNDPGMTEVNVNNSEVIKVKTLIQFAEALSNNTHVKTFALANCRADDHVAYAIANMLGSNKMITSINMDSNLLTSKGIMALVQALQYNTSLTELRFHNQRHICGGKTEMEMTKILKENTTLLKLGYHFELAGPRMTMTNILSRNMDRQRQKRLQEQKQATAQGNEDKKDLLKVPHPGFNKGSPRNSPKASPTPSPVPSPKLTPKAFKGQGGPPPPPPGGVPPPPPPPILDGEYLKNSLTPMSHRKLEDRSGGRGGGLNSRDQLLASIRGANMKELKKARNSFSSL